eukprot:m.47398 g.47398  ORF g.47398 m.47398 type:complete len:248 (+) comp10977_c0_seq1:2-745(+)
MDPVRSVSLVHPQHAARHLLHVPASHVVLPPDTVPRNKGGHKKTGQKHQNSVAYKAAKYGESKRMMDVRAMQVALVCLRCKQQIEWKKQFDKYKPRSKPGNCNICHQKTVTFAYHTICKPCATNASVCAKCGKADEAIVPPELTAAELQQQEAEERRTLLSMRERERRAFMRQQEKLRAEMEEDEDGEGGEDGEDGAVDGEGEEGVAQGEEGVVDEESGDSEEGEVDDDGPQSSDEDGSDSDEENPF